MVCAALSFLMSGLLQLYLHDPATACHGDVNIAWQLPQLLLISFAEVLVAVTGLEFAYSQAPQDFRYLLALIIQGLLHEMSSVHRRLRNLCYIEEYVLATTSHIHSLTA